MDFAVLPPEVNSARIYAGPGTGPMLAAASGWTGLAADLESSAAAYESTVSELTGGPWRGPSSGSMAAAAMRFVTWLRTTAEQARQAATQARQAAGAYEEAFAMIVAPPVIAANRSLLVALIASNLLGQNTSAIAATEAQYAGMWAQDVVAMYGYAGQSAVASALAPFPPAPQTTNAAPAALQGLAQPSDVTSALSGILEALGFTSAQSFLSLFGFISPYTATMATVNLCVGLSRMEDEENEGAAGSSLARALDSPQVASSWAGAVTVGGSSATAGLGEAIAVGGLSAPPAWTAAAPEFRTVARAAPMGAAGAAAAVSTGTPGTLLGEMALAPVAWRARGDAAGTDVRQGDPDLRQPFGPAQRQARVVPIASVADELHKLAELHTSHVLTDAEFDTVKRRLLAR